MISRQVSSALVSFGCLILLLFGCSVFRPVGNVISDGYENTVAYFNSYYNASKIYREALGEILENERNVRSQRGYSYDPIPAPRAAVGKLSVVIDKCSNILSFQPGSALVDDAVFLIGKSYFYQAEYLKAERKFSELLLLDVSDTRSLETSLWQLKTLEQLKKDEEGLQEGEKLVARARAKDEEEIAGEALLIMGILQSRTGDSARAIGSFSEAVQIAGDELTQAMAQYRIGDEWLRLEEPAKAAEAFRKVSEYTDDPGFVVSSGLEVIRALRAGGLHAESIDQCDELSKDYRFIGHRGKIDFERARTLSAQGNLNGAMQVLAVLDTTAARTDLGSRASFELARLLESQGRYADAQAAYTRSLGYPLPGIFGEAQKRSNGLAKYLTLWRQRKTLDSLLHAASVSSADSSVKNMAAIDSLTLLRAANAYEIAEVLYADLTTPDSAVIWYQRSLEGMTDSVKTPRILYVLAELNKTGSEEIYHRIIELYPGSLYALRAKIQLGLPVEPEGVDSAALMYSSIEAEMEAGRYENAVSGLRKIVNKYPLSPYAAKSAYTVGWLYEHRLAKPDSALAQYQSVIEHYGSTPYASSIRKRLNSSTALPDTSATNSREQQTPVAPRRADEEKGKKDTKKVIE